jgi:hypothetical protein
VDNALTYNYYQFLREALLKSCDAEEKQAKTRNVSIR